MQKRWMNRNIDLALLTNHVGSFFKERDFEAIKGETATGYNILAEDSPHFKLNGYVNVKIEGKPEDFTVKLELCGDQKGRAFAPILLTTMLVGGYFLSRKLRAQEDWTKLENEFWKYLDYATSHLNDTSEQLFDQKQH
jgi:hypothetical protein